MIGMTSAPLVGSAEFFLGFSINLLACATIAAYGKHFTLRR
jgi:hypothetical protein